MIHLLEAELVLNLSKSAGYRGMVGGQMLDLSADHSKMDINQITRLQRMKTGAMFVVSCEAGAILAKAPRQLRNAIRGYANDLGLAFQITDDLLDHDNDDRNDKTEGKATFVSAMGKEKALGQAKMLASQAKAHLDVFDDRANLLRELADFVVERQN